MQILLHNVILTISACIPRNGILHLAVKECSQSLWSVCIYGSLFHENAHAIFFISFACPSAGSYVIRRILSCSQCFGMHPFFGANRILFRTWSISLEPWLCYKAFLSWKERETISRCMPFQMLHPPNFMLPCLSIFRTETSYLSCLFRFRELAYSRYSFFFRFTSRFSRNDASNTY